ncbi:Lactonase, 7-bladed beta-propeller-domain-containing protein [Umbelopsis sp. PMI_123]|nr:Lactonase, 7-bladed beta-propeller-domain-containing protein [Umbelopsis sp. PMI_123]
MKQAAYISSYTDDGGEGIYYYSFDDGKLQLQSLAAGAVNPSFMVFHPHRQIIYTVDEHRDFEGSGGVSAYERNPENGSLNLLNTVTSKGADPCYVTVDKSGSHVLVANYTGGSVATFPTQSDGTIGEATTFIKHSGETKVNPARQDAPHAHSINLTPSGRYAIALDLGADKAVVYKYTHETGDLTVASELKFHPGDGPRHLKVSPFNDSWFYAVAELSNNIVFLEFDEASGTLNEIQRLGALPEDFKGENLASEINILPSGKFLYASMRGHDSLAIFAINENTGKLTKVGNQHTGGSHPRHFAIDPTGEYIIVANKDSHNLVVFKVDQATGLLTEVADSRVNHRQPVCIKFWTE